MEEANYLSYFFFHFNSLTNRQSIRLRGILNEDVNLQIHKFGHCVYFIDWLQSDTKPNMDPYANDCQSLIIPNFNRRSQ